MALSSEIVRLTHLVNHCVEVDQEDKGNNAEDDQSTPIEVSRIQWRSSQLGGMQDGYLVGNIGQGIHFLLVDNFCLKETSDSEDKRKESDSRHVFNDSLGQSVGLVHGLAIVDGVVDCDESFDGDGHRHEYGASEDDLRKGP